MNNFLFSIVTPVYNMEQYIAETIESVLSQTYSNWELILVDDGSKDLSGRICDEYAKKDERITVYHNENHGEGYSLNFGMYHARGEWIDFLDADDLLEPNALEIMANYSEGMDVIVFGHKEFPAVVEKKKTDRVIDFTSKQDLLSDFERLFDIGFFSSKNIKCYRKNAIHTCFGEIESHATDMIFNFEFFGYCGAMRMIPECLYLYRRERRPSYGQRFWVNSLDTSERIYRAAQNCFDSEPKVLDYMAKYFVREACNYCRSIIKIDHLSTSEKKLMIALQLSHNMFGEIAVQRVEPQSWNKDLWYVILSRDVEKIWSFLEQEICN